LNLGIKKTKNQRRGKIPAGAPLGIKSPLGTGMGGKFFPAAGNGAGTGGGDVSGDGDGDYTPRPRPAPLPSLNQDIIFYLQAWPTNTKTLMI